jgi:hypothetical protein
MRVLHALIVIPALALIVTSCGPHHRRCGGPDGAPCKGDKHAMRMHHHGGGHGACSYKSNWFSEGAVRSNDGVCQACSAGKWIAAEGCHECDKSCGHCDGKGKKGKKSSPCHHDGGHKRPHSHPHGQH